MNKMINPDRINEYVALATLVNGVNVIGTLQYTHDGVAFTVDEDSFDTPVTMHTTSLKHTVDYDNPQVDEWNIPVSGKTFMVLDKHGEPTSEMIGLFARLVVTRADSNDNTHTTVLFENTPSNQPLQFSNAGSIIPPSSHSRLRKVRFMYDKELYALACLHSRKNDLQSLRMTLHPSSGQNPVQEPVRKRKRNHRGVPVRNTSHTTRMNRE